MKDLKVLTHNAPWSRSVEFVIANYDPMTNECDVATSLVFTPLAIGAEMNRTFMLKDDAVQQLMDSLWTCGYRPSEGTGSAGAMAATERHLNDMRRLIEAEFKIRF